MRANPERKLASDQTAAAAPRPAPPQVEAALGALSDAFNAHCRAQRECSDAERALQDANAAEEAVRLRGLSPVPGLPPARRRSSGSGEEENDEEAVLPLSMRAGAAWAAQRADGAAAAAAGARARAERAAAELEDAQEEAEGRLREVRRRRGRGMAERGCAMPGASACTCCRRMTERPLFPPPLPHPAQLMATAAAAAPRHPLGPASLASWLLCPLEAPAAAVAATGAGAAPHGGGAADAAALRLLGQRLPLAPYLRPDVARCFWRLWRGKWARLVARFDVPASPAGGAAQQQQPQGRPEGAGPRYVDRLLHALEVGALPPRARWAPGGSCCVARSGPLRICQRRTPLCMRSSLANCLPCLRSIPPNSAGRQRAHLPRPQPRRAHLPRPPGARAGRRRRRRRRRAAWARGGGPRRRPGGCAVHV
jgi:hypothetical protein